MCVCEIVSGGDTTMFKNDRSLLATIILPLLLIMSAPVASVAQVWWVLAPDAKEDARDPSLADAAQLSYRYDKEQDMLWFRIALYGKPNDQAFGVNLVFDTGGDEVSKMNWWGGNKDFKFDKLATAWVQRRGDNYEGTIGIGDVTGVKARKLNNLSQNNLQIQLQDDAIVIGFKRKDLTEQTKLKVVAAVGSNERWNDDVPSTGASTVDVAAERPKRGLREIDTSRNNFHFPSGYRTLADNRAPAISKSGKGQQSLILIPGVYSGREAFAGFISRNGSQYKLYEVIPPGLAGTPARSLPAETVSYSEASWSRELERDILKLITKEKLSKPVIVAHGYPGSLVAHEIAIQHPEILGGVIDLAAPTVQLFFSPRDPTRKTPASLQERILYTNEGWAKKWFKYVTPETWDSNNYPVNMYSNDEVRAERARQQSEANLLQVKIRYLTEYMAADQTEALMNIKVPVLVLRPGFNDKILNDPANIFFKTYFLDSWEQFSKNTNIQILTIPDARALMLDDQPQATDEAIRKFINQLSRTSED